MLSPNLVTSGEDFYAKVSAEESGGRLSLRPLRLIGWPSGLVAVSLPYGFALSVFGRRPDISRTPDKES